MKLDLKLKYLRKIMKDKSGPACRSVENERVRYQTLKFMLCGRYSDLLQAGRSRDKILVGGEILCTHPDWSWGTTSVLYNG